MAASSSALDRIPVPPVVTQNVQPPAFESLPIDEKREFLYIHFLLSIEPKIRIPMLYYEFNRISYGLIPTTEETFTNHVVKIIRHVPNSMNQPPLKIKDTMVCGMKTVKNPNLDIFRKSNKKKPGETPNQTNTVAVPLRHVSQKYCIEINGFGIEHAIYPFASNDPAYIIGKPFAIIRKQFKLPFEFAKPKYANPKTVALTKIHENEMKFFLKMPYMLEPSVIRVNEDDISRSTAKKKTRKLTEDEAVEKILKDHFKYTWPKVVTTMANTPRLKSESIMLFRRSGHYMDLSHLDPDKRRETKKSTSQLEATTSDDDTYEPILPRPIAPTGGGGGGSTSIFNFSGAIEKMALAKDGILEMLRMQ